MDSALTFSINWNYQPDSVKFTASITLTIPCNSEGYLPLLLQGQYCLLTETASRYWGNYRKGENVRYSKKVLSAETLEQLHKLLESFIKEQTERINQAVSKNTESFQSLPSPQEVAIPFRFLTEEMEMEEEETETEE